MTIAGRRRRVSEERLQQMTWGIRLGEHGLVEAQASGLFEAQEQLDTLQAAERQFSRQGIIEPDRASGAHGIELSHQALDDVENQCSVKCAKNRGWGSHRGMCM
jgi:hypothetical protein